jgi:hypothetical protein
VVTWSARRSGRRPRISAAVAETNGAAKLLPSKPASRPSRVSAGTADPGATTSTNGPSGEVAER